MQPGREPGHVSADVVLILAVKCDVGRILSGFLFRQIALPEIVEETEDLFVFCCDDKDRDADIEGGENIREGPESIRLSACCSTLPAPWCWTGRILTIWI